MDLAFVIRHRLEEMGLEQRALAAAVQVTESYISQLLTGSKAPPAPARTDLYPKMERYLLLPRGELSKLAALDRQEQLKKKIADPPRPLFQEFRGLILRKCDPDRRRQIGAIFEKQPFGELERLVSQKLLDVAKAVAREELANDKWLRSVARLSRKSYAQMRVRILEFLDTDVFHVSLDNWVSFIDPLIQSWDIDLETFALEIALNRSLAPGHLRRFEYVERNPEPPSPVEPGLEEFLSNPALSGDATEHEIEFLKRLSFQDRRPTALYYYRELQNLRDPLHFTRDR
jgi:transcriptional regulator with XRE-family HTH domain